MLTTSEIYYLNSALDGSKVYGIDSMKALAEESVKKKSSEESLKEKKLLNEDGSISNLGFVMIKRLHDYKASTSYIWADNKIIGFNESPYLIELMCNEKGSYSMERTLKAQIVAKIFKDKLFLLGDKEVTEAKKVINVNRISRVLELKTSDEMLFLRKEEEGYISLYNVYFSDEDSVFKYDVLRKSVHLVNPKDAREEILDLFNIKRGE